MSSIAFHSKEETVRAAGCERASMSCLVTSFGRCMASLVDRTYLGRERDRLRFVIAELTGRRDPIQDHMLDLSLEVLLSSFRGVLYVEGEEWSPWHLCINSMLEFGSDTMRLMARIHAQCEVHGYVEGRNRGWIASLIQRALDNGLLRPDKFGYDGWDEVMRLLRSRADGPVVMSYSVTDTFPSYPHRVSCTCDEAYPCEGCQAREDWEELAYEERWRTSLKVLRERNKDNGYLEMKPEDWSEVRFNDGRTTRDLDYAIQRMMEET